MGSSRTHDGELPAILKPLRIGSPANCKHKALVLTDYTSNGSEIQRAQALVRGARKIFESRTLESFTSCNQRSLCTKVCLQNVRPSLCNFSSGIHPRHFDLRTCCACLPSTTSILEMRSGRKNPSPGSGRRCLMGWEDIKGISKAYPTFLRLSELS